MKSAFDNIKDSLCKEIQNCKSLTKLKSKLDEFQEELDLEEEDLK